MSAKDRAELEQAVRYGLESLSGGAPMQKWYGLLAMRTVCFHLKLDELHKEINVLLKNTIEVSE
uniref:Uncharacterized protein n=1 Tax=Geobacter sp. (strain M21) TaxID=443144 RepID=C6E6U3_GEOSM